jgi:2-polyprenyl-3-methyl-5-hydroxy-6-metoxy-1,4-benzoquinol methylase
MSDGASLTFDRSSDPISKLEGCETRGVSYRWEVFTKHLANVPAGAAALDFGAGSLRESFDLANRGFDVTSIDIDAKVLAAYEKKYDWPSSSKHRLIASPDLFGALDGLGNHFSIITAFDVLEHLDDPVAATRALASHLRDDGLMFISVPNGRTLFELAFRLNLILVRVGGGDFPPGEAHLQRNSPGKWARLFRQTGLSILDHEMAFGFFVNNTAALVQLPIRMLGRITRRVGIRKDMVLFSEAVIKGGKMRALDWLDRRTKPLLSGLYGTNLFVLGRKNFGS